MKIKKLLKNSAIFFSPFILILFILFCINIFIKDLNFGHKAFNVKGNSMDWFTYYYYLNKKKINNYLISFIKKDEKGLPKVEINISEKSLNKLLSDVPSSTKKYVSAEFKKDNLIQKVQMRYFGDNPINWMFHQKAIRLKTKKKELINGKRYFEYKPSQRNIISDYTAYKFAKKLGILVSDVRLVELFINNNSSGIYIERENLNESFLRRNKIMPVNLYKGEASRNSEKKIGLVENLDENPGLWEKVSFLNTVKTSDYKDLENFINNQREADISNEKLKNLLNFGNAELFAKIAILESLLNQEINDYTHNRRLLIDVWSGKKHIIPHDFYYNKKEINEDSFNLDICSTRLFCILNQSSEFLDIKYSLLYKIVIEEKIFDEVIKDLEEIKSQFLVTQKTDLGSIFRKYVLARQYEGPENKESFENILNSLKIRKNKLIKILETDPNASWKKNENGFDLMINDSMPISNLLISFEKQKPKWIILDYNKNKIIDQNDIYFYPNINGNFKIDLKFFANRILINKNKLTTRNEIKTSNTSISFFVNQKLSPFEIFTFNNFTNQLVPIKKGEYTSNLPSLHNQLILNKENKKNIFNGKIYLDKDLVLHKETEIIEGTEFIMDKDVSILFKNKVTAIGSDNKPIIFTKKTSSDSWGTIAFHGKNLDGSVIKNVIIEGGSGKVINGVNYFSSLSVHSANNMRFENILVKNNSIYDDMMHVIYSDNISILNSNFLNAYLDSIDVDISKNILFKNTNIVNSGNDGIDFMESNAYLDNMSFIYSGDKGVSVGENSNININNSTFKKNNFGLASKDSSKAIISNSLFEDNKIHLSTYKKNWRYGESGYIEIKNSKFNSLNNKIISDESGEIFIFSSNFNGEILKSKNVSIN